MMPLNRSRNIVRTTGFIFLAVILLTCEYSPAGTSASTKAENSAGTVLETMNAGGYTYLLVDSGVQKTWVAVPETPVKKGEKVRFSQGMLMENFHSKTLDRTFAAIVFSPGLEGGEQSPATKVTAKPSEDQSFTSAVQAESAQKSAPEGDMTASGGSSGAVAPFAEIKIEKAKGENSHTVGEIFAKTKDLNGQVVRLQAKVVKMNPNIMGRNWLHLQDGTGDPMANSHDLVVTTAGTPSLDQIVTVEGKVTANKDFGAGYSYVVIIEDAKIIP